MATKTKAPNLTGLETKMLRNIARNLYQPGNGAEPATFADTSDVWSNCLNDARTHGAVGDQRVPDGSIAGVVSSLVKKGLLITSGSGSESTVRLSEAGFVAYKGLK